ncbi:hypothetical protein SAMN05216553_10691 [Lentzea fradiae]|uniref:Uncharacterized protein n=1 Tax=Lentzea fradiae TaxID=200378 RepID=A0A1G7S7A3_9PSEU|nr:hypothetical protein SAMN05216553_10691 [Lentzea fradiae]
MPPPGGTDHVRMKGAKLLLIVRCLVSFAIGVLLVVLAVRFGEALWRAFH